MIYFFMLLLIILSAFFSGSEIAFASANKIRLKNAADSGNKTAAKAYKITENYTKSISVILIGNNLVNIAASSVATLIAVNSGRNNAEAIGGVVITIIILLFGEIFPKIICSEYADKLVLIFCYPIIVFSVIFKPVVSAVSFIVNKMAHLWTPKGPAPSATQEEVITLLETIEDEGVFTEKESELIKSAIELSDLTARDILIPRVDVQAFDIEDGLEELIRNKDLLSHSRFPVFRETIDNIIGIMPTKKLLKELLRKPEVDIESLLIPPIYVHMTRDITSILLEFKKSRCHMAVVVDEFGGVMGILTIEDIIEEIVGDIYDESDIVEKDIIEIGENEYEVDGSTNTYDFFEYIDFDDRDFESEYTTVGGWSTEMLDKIPNKGDTFTYKNLTVEVTEASLLRVEKLVIKVEPEENEE